MSSSERRNNIEIELRSNTDPISATELARKFSVSRQIIVGDIALMRAAGLKISATPKGYIINSQEEKNENIYTIACCHDETNMAAELYAVVDNGGELLDVTVEHPIYGQIVGQLCISSRYDADLFLQKIKNNQAQPLMRLTGGIHIHTIKCNNKEAFERIKIALKQENMILDEE